MNDKNPEKAAEAPADELIEENEETATVDTDDPVAALESEVATLKTELADNRDRLLRTVAEMDNLRKRTRREVLDSRRFAQADLLRPLLEVLDNFDRALAHASDAGDTESFEAGVAMIAQSFRQTLLDRGVRPIEAEGQQFDPVLHEAVGQQPAPEGTESGTILAVVQEGYMLEDFVLRASRVIVAQ